MISTPFFSEDCCFMLGKGLNLELFPDFQVSRKRCKKKSWHCLEDHPDYIWSSKWDKVQQPNPFDHPKFRGNWLKLCSHFQGQIVENPIKSRLKISKGKSNWENKLADPKNLALREKSNRVIENQPICFDGIYQERLLMVQKSCTSWGW